MSSRMSPRGGGGDAHATLQKDRLAPPNVLTPAWPCSGSQLETPKCTRHHYVHIYLGIVWSLASATISFTLVKNSQVKVTDRQEDKGDKE